MNIHRDSELSNTIDFSNAFIQATLKDDTYIHLPRGFQGSGSDVTPSIGANVVSPLRQQLRANADGVDDWYACVYEP